MRTILPWRFQYFNLRNHRKILVIDGRVGFTGGMNIRDGNCLADNPSHPVQDLHFQIEGPVVAELQRSFAEDWSFTTREILEGEKWYPHLDPQGNPMLSWFRPCALPHSVVWRWRYSCPPAPISGW
jgi:cardiolipin synthase